MTHDKASYQVKAKKIDIAFASILPDQLNGTHVYIHGQNQIEQGGTELETTPAISGKMRQILL